MYLWVFYQRECHRLLEECFSKRDAYMWLKKEFGVEHFSDLSHKKDMDKIRMIYEKLYVKSFGL
jgi:hypothetical protein